MKNMLKKFDKVLSAIFNGKAKQVYDTWHFRGFSHDDYCNECIEDFVEETFLVDGVKYYIVFNFRRTYDHLFPMDKAYLTVEINGNKCKYMIRESHYYTEHGTVFDINNIDKMHPYIRLVGAKYGWIRECDYRFSRSGAEKEEAVINWLKHPFDPTPKVAELEVIDD